jgi:hypothetical protein
MPTVSQAPIFNRIVYVQGDHVFAPDESIASVDVMPPAGLTLFLPGPTSPVRAGTARVLPGDGDYYEVQDVKGLCSAGTPITLDGGGYPIRHAGASTATSISNVAGSGCEVTFHNKEQAWYLCPCLWIQAD